ALSVEGKLAAGRDPLAPGLDAAIGDLEDAVQMFRPSGLLAGRRDLLEELAEDFVQQAPFVHGREPPRGIALDVLGRFDAEHASDEVGEGARSEALDAGRGERLASRPRIELRSSGTHQPVPDGELLRGARLLGPPAVFEPRVERANDL